MASDVVEPRATSSRLAAELITQAIVEGVLEPGQRLQETKLAEQLGLGRTPVREALKELGSRGLVVTAPNRGATVRSYDPDTLDDLYQLRALLEGHAARLAAQRRGADHVRALEASCVRFAALVEDGDTAGYRDLVAENGVFHGVVTDAAASAHLSAMLEHTVELPLVYRSFVHFSPQQRRESLHAHRKLAELIAAGAAERAEAAMREHILTARDVLVAQLREAGRSSA